MLEEEQDDKEKEYAALSEIRVRFENRLLDLLNRANDENKHSSWLHKIKKSNTRSLAKDAWCWKQELESALEECSQQYRDEVEVDPTAATYAPFLSPADPCFITAATEQITLNAKVCFMNQLKHANYGQKDAATKTDETFNYLEKKAALFNKKLFREINCFAK